MSANGTDTDSVRRIRKTRTPPSTVRTTLADHIPQTGPSSVTNGTRNTGYPGRTSKIRMKRSDENGAMNPPVCPARSRASTPRHSASRHFFATRAAGSLPWKVSGLTLWSRRAVAPLLAQE